MAFNKLFSYAEADIPRRSGHDEFHRHAFTLTPGTLTPTFWDFVVPGDIISVAPKFHFQMPPQATDFIGRINLRTELFYVPMRTMWAGFKDFISYPSDGIGGPAPDDPAYHAKYLPGAKFESYAQTSLPQIRNDSDYTEEFNPTVSIYPVIGSTVEELSQAFHAAAQDTLLKYLTYIQKNEPFIISVDDGYNVGPGSLLDYLGFKISLGSTSSVENLWNTVKQSYYDSYFAGYQSQIDNAMPTEFPSADLNIGFPYYTSVDGETSITANFYAHFDLETNKVYTYISVTSTSLGSEITVNNITVPFAYHKIYNDWYMDKRVMKPLLPNALTDSPASALANIAYMPKYGGGFNKKYYEGDNLLFYDGKSVFDLRQRLWQKDYFTTMTTQPQAGEAASVTFDTTGDTGEFTIASLRVANAMQLWRERMNLVDPEYSDAIFAQYGVYPDDSVTGKAIYLGSCTQEVYNKSVYQQGDFSGATNNPINSVGAKYASPMAVGGNSLCNDYHIREHGIVMAITSLVPEAMYSTGTRRQFHYDTIDDIAFPLLQGVGDQPVYAREIVDTYSGEGDKTVIGYQQRYTEYRFINDNVSGLLRDGQSLEAFALQRSFAETPELGASFLEIPKTYLDQVSAVGIENSKFGAWVSSAWNYTKASRFSALASMPTLGHMKNTETISVVKAGKRL